MEMDAYSYTYSMNQAVVLDGSVIVQSGCPAQVRFSGTLESQDMSKYSVTLEQTARASNAAMGSQVQLLEPHAYCGMDHGLD